MARDIGFDVSILGDKDLVRRLKRLEKRVQRKIISKAFRASAYRVREDVVNRFRTMTTQQTGKTAEQLAKMKVRSAGGGRGGVRIGILWPDREALGIASDDPYYYPAAIEYGRRGVPARPFTRSAVDASAGEELRRITKDMRDQIVRTF